MNLQLFLILLVLNNFPLKLQCALNSLNKLTTYMLIYRDIRYIVMFDILNITEAQARVLRAIAYYEIEEGKKGATQYACSKKVPNQWHVSGSTFNDNIKDLEKNLMVLKLKGTTEGDRETKPYSITDIGQIAWLRHFPLVNNMSIIQKIFPNIQISLIDDIINQINHPEIKKIRNKFAGGVLETALKSFHIENSLFITTDYFRPSVEEIVELSGYYDLLRSSFRRRYNIIHPVLYKELCEKHKGFSKDIKNFDELEISVIDRVTFLFYYNLIQSVLESGYAMKVISSITTEQKTTKKFKESRDMSINESLLESTKSEFLKVVRGLTELSLEISKKKKV